MILETPRLLLRPFAESDLDDLSALMANADFMRFSWADFPANRRRGFSKKFGRAIVQGYPRNSPSSSARTEN